MNDIKFSYLYLVTREKVKRVKGFRIMFQESLFYEPKEIHMFVEKNKNGEYFTTTDSWSKRIIVKTKKEALKLKNKFQQEHMKWCDKQIEYYKKEKRPCQ